jgi:hypothetical protein
MKNLEKVIKTELIRLGFTQSGNLYKYKDITIFDISSDGISLFDNSCDEYGRYDITMWHCKKKDVTFYIKGLIEYQGKLDKLGYTHYDTGL